MLEETNNRVSNPRRCAQIRQLNRLANIREFCSCGSKRVWLQCPIQCELDSWEESEPREPVYFDGLPHDASGFLK